MAIITEDYVSFETAKLLKEKGFDQNCATYYLNGQVWRHYHGEVIPKGKQIYAAPTQAMVMKWLRENFGYNILIIADGDLVDLHYTYEIQEIDNKLLQVNGSLDIEDQRFDTYEEACEAAIKYCLENLI